MVKGQAAQFATSAGTQLCARRRCQGSVDPASVNRTHDAQDDMIDGWEA